MLPLFSHQQFIFSNIPMEALYVLDFFMNKNFKISDCPEEIKKNLKHGEKIIYRCEDKGNMKDSIGIIVGYPLPIERKGEFVRAMSQEEQQKFCEDQKIALDFFPLFKKKFKSEFSGSKPITARYNPLGDQIYFYFYSEDRYVFGDFVKNLRNIVGKNIFLFQVGARDMMRLDPCAKDYAIGSDCWMHQACLSYGLMPSVEVECVSLQGLDWRDLERLKGRCGKLKCSLMYELEIYQKECKNFPQKWTKLPCPWTNQNGIVSSFNIMTREVVLKTPEGMILRVPLSSIKSIDS